MAQSRKKVILRRLDNTHLAGYLPVSAFVLDESTLDLIDLEGRSLPLRLGEVKTIAYVRDFNLADDANPERFTRTAFLSRPRAEGLWLRITFTAGDHFEGLAPLDLALFDGLVEDAGVFLTPPDDRANTHRVFIPHSAIASLQILAVITTPSKAARPSKVKDDQSLLFPPVEAS